MIINQRLHQKKVFEGMLSTSKWKASKEDGLDLVGRGGGEQ